MLRMELVQKEILDDVEETLRAEFMSNLARTDRRDNHEIMAEIFNSLDRSTETRFLELLEERNKEAADRVRALMFTFEDLTKIDGPGIQTLLRNVDNGKLGLALKGASEKLRELFFANMSERASKILRDDMETMGPVRLRDVEDAQVMLVNTAKDLAAAGQVFIADGKDDEMLAYCAMAMRWSLRRAVRRRRRGRSPGAPLARPGGDHRLPPASAIRSSIRRRPPLPRPRPRRRHRPSARTSSPARLRRPDGTPPPRPSAVRAELAASLEQRQAEALAAIAVQLAAAGAALEQTLAARAGASRELAWRSRRALAARALALQPLADIEAMLREPRAAARRPAVARGRPAAGTDGCGRGRARADRRRGRLPGRAQGRARARPRPGRCPCAMAGRCGRARPRPDRGRSRGPGRCMAAGRATRRSTRPRSPRCARSARKPTT